MPFPLLAAALPSLIGLAGNLLSKKGSGKAADQQVAGQQAAIDTSKEFLSPFQQAGAAGLGGLQSFVDEGSNFSDTQAFKDIVNTQRSSGGKLSGNTLSSLTDFYANNFRNQRLNELSVLPQLGAQAAGQLASNIGGIQQNIGDINASGTVGKTNAITGAIGFGGNLASTFLNRNTTSLAT
jgi:hypothetical protein